MRLLHVSDFHHHRPWFDWLAGVASGYDICCLSGDLLDLLVDRKNSITKQARWVGEWMAAFSGRLCVCSGNHDWWTRDERFVDINAEAAWLTRRRRPGILVDGDSEVIEGYRFACKPWVGRIPLPADHPVVLVAHGPPERTEVSSELGSESGDFETTDLIGGLPTGSLVLSGHVHHPRRWHAAIGGVRCFNPGWAAGQDRPNHIVIDLDRRKAEWFGQGHQSGPVHF